VGIDVQARVKIKEILKKLSGGGMSMIYTTHQMDEAEELCDRIAIIDEGQIIADGTLKDLVSQLKERDSVELTGSFAKDVVNPLVKKIRGAVLIQFAESKIILEVEKEDSIPLIIQKLMAERVVIDSVDIRRPNLETLFIKLTGKELRDQ
jgi:ABC-2 type transport system ATP-binding protein